MKRSHFSKAKTRGNSLKVCILSDTSYLMLAAIQVIPSGAVSSKENRAAQLGKWMMKGNLQRKFLEQRRKR